jgi:hypothetical protein
LNFDEGYNDIFYTVAFAMHDSPRFTINRSAIVLLPKQPVLDWIMRVDPDPLNLTLEQLRQEQDVFLLRQGTIESIDDAQRWVYRRWRGFFERYLYDWFTKEEWWPQNRTLKMFKEWFDVQYHSMIWDLAAEPIQHEDWDAMNED